MKAQLQIGENIITVVIVTLLIIFSIVFFARIDEASAGETKRTFGELDAIQLATVVSSLPELRCSFTKVEEVSCVDVYKANATRDLIPRPEFIQQYVGLFRNAKINITEVWPRHQEIIVYENHYGDEESETAIQVPVTIYDPVEDRHGFGVLTITRYSG